MTKHTKLNLFLIVSFLYIFAWYFYPAHFFDAEELRHFTREDSFIEMSGALFFLAGSLIMFYVYIHSKSFNDYKFFKCKRNIFFLLLSIFMFLSFGEEISWGQRLFGIATPEVLKGVNTQKEINIHNITIFHAGHEDYIIGHHALIRNFIYLYCVALPLLNLRITFVSKIITRMGLPVASLIVALLFIFNEALNVIAWLSYPARHSDLYEVYESMWGYLFFIFSLDQLTMLRDNRDKQLYNNNPKPAITRSIA